MKGHSMNAQSTAQLSSLACYLDQLAQAHPQVSRPRIGALYERAAAAGIGDSFSSVRIVGRCLERSGSALGAAQAVLRAAPWSVAHRRGDGSQVVLTLPAHTPTTPLTDSWGTYEGQVWEWQGVDPSTPLRWGHDGPSVGSVLATRAAPAGDLQVWCQLTDRSAIELAAFDELSASPTIKRGSKAVHGGPRWGGLPRLDIHVANVSEIALVPRGTGALPIPVQLEVAPAALVRSQSADLFHLRGQ
jgi:hypothetical protein